MVTHEENIAAYADRIIRMSDGQIIEDKICVKQ
jgi:putative ABC transport system ATP-binding protein